MLARVKKTGTWVLAAIMILVVIHAGWGMQQPLAGQVLTSEPNQTSWQEDQEGLLPAQTAYASLQEVSSPSSLEPIRRNLKTVVRVKNTGKGEARNIQLEVPLLGNIDSPYQLIVNEHFSHKPMEIKEGDLNSRIALFTIPALAPGAEEMITLEYTLSVFPVEGLAANLSTGLSGIKWEYLKPLPKVESDHPEIIAKAREIAAAAGNDMEKVRNIYRFVINHMSYNPNSPYRNQGALSALRNCTGVCEDYAALFVALTRASGIPARLVNGYADPLGTGKAWAAPVGKEVSLAGYRHSWAEFYLEGIGWVPVDPTLDIYSDSVAWFGRLPGASHIAQNYLDNLLRVRYQGSPNSLSISWQDVLVIH